MTALNILLGIVAFVLLLFVVGETKPPMSKERHQNITLAFVAVIALIIALNVIY